MLDLSIIIVSYNTKDFLNNCINSLLNCISKKINYEITVVDNASTDGSVKEVQNYNSKIKIIANKENLGFSKANNIGIRASSKSRYILFLNSDTLMQKKTIEEMIEFMDTHRDAGASTCKLVMPNGKIDDASHRGFPTPWNALCHFSGLEKLFPKSKLFAGYSLGWKNFERTHGIDALAGAFMLVRREAGEQVGWWDEDYFFYGEDIDFCFMLKQKDWKIYYVPTVSITHYKGVSGGIKTVSKEITTASEETKKRVQKWRFDAMRVFYKKHYSQRYPRFVNFLVNLGISIKENL